jgi:hypothetical protein
MDLMAWLRSNWERSLGVACLAAGSAATVAGLLGVRSSRFLAEDLSYLLSGGVGGLLLIGVGATLLITARLHVMRQDLLRAADVVRASAESPVVELPEPARTDTSPGELRTALPTPVRSSAN